MAGAADTLAATSARRQARGRIFLSSRYLVPLAVASPLFLFLLLPVFSILVVSVVGREQPILKFVADGRVGDLLAEWVQGATLEYWRTFFREDLYIQALLNSLKLAASVTVAATVLGFLLAYAVTRTTMPGKRLVRMLAVLPMISPPFIGAYAFTLLLGDKGFVTRIAALYGLELPIDIFTPTGVWLVQVFAFTPFVLLTSAAVLDQTDPSLEEASETLAADGLHTFFRVTVPLALPGLSAGALLAFIGSLADFGTPMVLAPRRFPLIPVEAFRELLSYNNWGMASTLSAVMVVFAVLALLAQRFVVDRRQYETITGKRRLSARLTRQPVVMTLFAVYSVLFLALPVTVIAIIVLMSFTQVWGTEIFPTVYTLEHYSYALFSGPAALRNSLLLSGGAVLLTMAYAVVIAYLLQRGRYWGRQWLDTLVMLPLVMPGTAIAIGLILAFNSGPITLVQTPWILLVSYSIRRLPYAVRGTYASLQQLDRSLEESSLTLGATPFLTGWRVLVPLILPGILAGGILVFITTMEGISDAILLYAPGWAPLSIEVYTRVLASEVYRAAAFAVILIAVVGILRFVVSRLTEQRALNV